MKNYNFDSTWADMINSMSKSMIGADRMFESIAKTTEAINKAAVTYPPYNIKKIDDNKYVIELAVAGFSKHDLEITLEEGMLIIDGKMSLETAIGDGVNQTIFFKGISERPFKKVFALADTVEIKNADLINGLLKIWLENVIPESKKPKKIDIGETKKDVGPQLLTEEDL
jgi:molecular chaperone IbpA